MVDSALRSAQDRIVVGALSNRRASAVYSAIAPAYGPGGWALQRLLQEIQRRDVPLSGPFELVRWTISAPGSMLTR